MKVLVACEESQTVTKAFRELGHRAFSCDTQPCSGGHPEWHIQGDVIPLLTDMWDLLIAHPPCTYLSSAGAMWFNEDRFGEKARIRKELREEAFKFFMKFAEAPIDKICIENPLGYVNSHWRKPDQIVQPYYFGDPESKRTCLWLKGLPLLTPTKVVEPKIYGYIKSGRNKGKPIYFSGAFGETKQRAKLRSKTFPGMARAFAKQWG